MYYHNRYIEPLLEKCKQTAKRCHALMFVNTLSRVGDDWRNTTFCFNREGELAGKYFKKHIPPSELHIGVDDSYTMQPQEPYVLELDGVRFGFLTCYDFYFYEAFPRIARANVDIIIGCSLQRSDSHDAIETMCRLQPHFKSCKTVRYCQGPVAIHIYKISPLISELRTHG